MHAQANAAPQAPPSNHAERERRLIFAHALLFRLVDVLDRTDPDTDEAQQLAALALRELHELEV